MVGPTAALCWHRAGNLYSYSTPHLIMRQIFSFFDYEGENDEEDDRNAHATDSLSRHTHRQRETKCSALPFFADDFDITPEAPGQDQGPGQSESMALTRND